MIRIICEPKFTDSTWCREIVRGIADAAKKKRLTVSEDGTPESGDMAAIAASSPEWIAEKVREYSSLGAVAVLIGTCPSGVDICSVSTDITHTVSSLLSYLRHDCGCERTALYGVNRSSVEDISKLDAFAKATHGESGGVYFNTGKLDDCFSAFLCDARRFDSVICTNDYAAVSLVKSLEKSGIKVPGDIKIASFSGTLLAENCTPSVTSAEMNFYEYGRSAVEVYSMLLKNPCLSSASVKMKCGIVPRETTGFTPCSDKSGVVYEAVRSLSGGDVETRFYDDSTVSSLLTLGNLLSSCDTADLEMLPLLAKGLSYEVIAERLYMSANGVKYRVKRLIGLCGVCGVSGKKELAHFLSKYI